MFVQTVSVGIGVGFNPTSGREDRGRVRVKSTAKKHVGGGRRRGMVLIREGITLGVDTTFSHLS